MIFDSTTASKLYSRATLGDKQALSELHAISIDFIRAVAMSVSIDNVEDLTQEGHIKLHTLVLNDSIDLTRRSLYTYLSIVLKHHMIDHMRRYTSHALLTDKVECPSIPDQTVELPSARLYLGMRFPSLVEGASCDMADYLVQALSENVRDMRKRVIRTLYNLYPINKARALVVYHVAEIAVAAELLRLEPSYDRALESATNGHEFTLIPEYILVTGLSSETCPNCCSTTGYALYIKNLLREVRSTLKLHKGA